MENIVAVLSLLQSTIGSFAGFGIDNSYSVANFFMLVSLSLFGAACLSHLSDRRDNVHVALNVFIMFSGGVLGNALLRGLHLPMGNELVLTLTLALFGMSAGALMLLLTYHRTEI